MRPCPLPPCCRLKIMLRPPVPLPKENSFAHPPLPSSVYHDSKVTPVALKLLARSTGSVKPMLSAFEPFGAPSRTNCPSWTRASPIRTAVFPPAESRVSAPGAKEYRWASAGGNAPGSSAEFGSVPLSISCPSGYRSPSESALAGSVECSFTSAPSPSPSPSESTTSALVPNVPTSSPSVRPSRSVSESVGSVPATSSCLSVRPSPSKSPVPAPGPGPARLPSRSPRPLIPGHDSSQRSPRPSSSSSSELGNSSGPLL